METCFKCFIQPLAHKLSQREARANGQNGRYLLNTVKQDADKFDAYVYAYSSAFSGEISNSSTKVAEFILHNYNKISRFLSHDSW